MLVDPSSQVLSGFLQFDVCIVGSGPAGITLAREISRSGLRVALLESGGNKPVEETQNLNIGAVESVDGYEEQTLSKGRCRQFGGTSNLWNHKVRGGSADYIRYVPLDEIDFERRDWVPESGWPFSRRDLEPFYDNARRVCGVGKLDFRALKNATRSQPWQTERIESVVSQFGSSEIFLDQYRRDLFRDERVTVFLRAVLLRLEMDPLSRAITSAEAALPDGRKFQVMANAFVLAAGGLENARILLLQDHIQPGGLGNQHDMVGRCFMDHPQIKLGKLVPSSSAVFKQAQCYDQHELGGKSIMFKLHIRAEVMRREKMLNLCAVVVPHFKDLRSSGRAIPHQLLFRGPRFLWRYRSSKHHGSSQMGGEAPRSLRQRLLEDYYSEGCCGWSKLSGFERRFSEFGIHSLVEQSPDPSNRIILQEQTDSFNQRKTKLLWRWNELDLRSIRQAQQILREELAAAGVGAFTPVEETIGGAPRRFSSPHHFLGTTRMHDDARKGVVDANCRVHDVPNLYIAGSSVFPTGGFANPTLTIVALSLRLGTHLLSELQSRPEIQTERTSSHGVNATGRR